MPTNAEYRRGLGVDEAGVGAGVETDTGVHHTVLAISLYV